MKNDISQSRDIGSLSVRVLIDNMPSECDTLYSEHGLSLHIEYGECKILCDMGSSAGFMANAEKMGIDLSQVDFGVVTHAHNDHTGGLPDFLEAYPQTTVFCSEEMFGSCYFSTRRGVKRDLTPDFDRLEKSRCQMVPIVGSIWLRYGIAVVDCSGNPSANLYGNSFLYKEFCNGEVVKDDFRHEMALVFKLSGGLVIVSSCSHNGVANIIRKCCEFTGESSVVAFIGGFHIVDSDYLDDEVSSLVQDVDKECRSVRFYTGHCTNPKAFEKLRSECSCFLDLFRTGDLIRID